MDEGVCVCVGGCVWGLCVCVCVCCFDSILHAAVFMFYLLHLASSPFDPL